MKVKRSIRWQLEATHWCEYHPRVAQLMEVHQPQGYTGLYDFTWFTSHLFSLPYLWRLDLCQQRVVVSYAFYCFHQCSSALLHNKRSFFALVVVAKKSKISSSLDTAAGTIAAAALNAIRSLVIELLPGFVLLFLGLNSCFFQNYDCASYTLTS